MADCAHEDEYARLMWERDEARRFIQQRLGDDALTEHLDAVGKIEAPEAPPSERDAGVRADVEAAHQRIHRNLGTECHQMVYGERRPNIACTELDCAYAALDVDDPSMIEMPWRSHA